MKYFGTDGIRKNNKDLTPMLIKKIANAIVKHYNKNKLNNYILVGNDSRINSDYILAVLQTVLLKNNICIHNIGICSSPCLAFLSKKFNYPLSIMISASHNPADYNGIKFFNSNGEKVDEIFELDFEKLMDSAHLKTNKVHQRIIYKPELKQHYIDYLKNIKNFNFPCIFDCANGGSSEICKQVFKNYDKINISPNGLNINQNAGCTHIEMLQKLCIKNKKIGFSFDGDGDRIHVIDTDGTILKGDEILYILSTFYQRTGDVLVGTIYTNSALEILLKQRNISLFRTDVGDKNVCKAMHDLNSCLGGEDSGHIILKPYTNTGDGVLIAIILANIIQLSKKSLKELLANYKPKYQARSNIKTKINTEEMEKIIQTYKKQNAKIIIRPSGTEPVTRLFVEHENEQTAKEILKQVENILVGL